MNDTKRFEQVITDVEVLKNTIKNRLKSFDDKLDVINKAVQEIKNNSVSQREAELLQEIQNKQIEENERNIILNRNSVYKLAGWIATISILVVGWIVSALFGFMFK